MSIPAGSTKVVLSGVAPQGEIFATGFWLTGGAINSEASANIAAQALADMGPGLEARVEALAGFR